MVNRYWPVGVTSALGHSEWVCPVTAGRSPVLIMYVLVCLSNVIQ